MRSEPTTTVLARMTCVALILCASTAGADENVRHLGPGGEVALGDGWITTVPALPFVTHAANEDTLLAGTSLGVFAVWSKGEWVASFVDEPSSKAARVTRMPDGTLALSVCGRTCRTRTLGAGGTSAPVEVPRISPLPQSQDRIAPWWVRSLRIHRRVSDVTEHFDLRTLSSSTNPCGNGLSIVGDARAPFASCSIYTASSLHHFDGTRFTAIVEPWSTGWAPNAQAVYEGAGCAPCFISETILWRDSAGWHQAAPPPGLSVSHLPVRDVPTLSVAVIAPGALAISVAGVSHALVGGAWHPHSEQIVGAIRGTQLRVGSERPDRALLSVAPHTRGFATPSWLVLTDEKNGVAVKAWADFLDPNAQPAGVVDVIGVAADDVLRVRRGPHASSPEVGSLAANAKGIKVLSAAQKLSGQTWRAVVLDDGTRGWVNGRYLRPAR